MDYSTGRREDIYTRRQIEDLISQGQTIIIVDRNVLKVDSWLSYHPGGDKAIMHMVGRDATDEVNAYVLTTRFRSIIISDTWKDFTHQKHDNR